MNEIHIQPTPLEIAEANFEYYKLRAVHEMPHPDSRTINALGWAALRLSMEEEKNDDLQANTVTLLASSVYNPSLNSQVYRVLGGGKR